MLELECVELSPGVEQDVLFIVSPSILVLAVAVKGEHITDVVTDTVLVALKSSTISSPLLFTKCNFPSSPI